MSEKSQEFSGFDLKTNRQKMTALVISYNRAKLIGTCLRALAFADEILVVDKSSTDGTAEIAAMLADRVISVPWSPVVEDTRAFAIAQCKYDWVLCLDDDECLSTAAIDFFRNEMLAPRAKVYAIAQRHYILGRHDERAYYWPEHQVRFFDRNTIDINPAVHGGFGIKTDAFHQISPDSGICLHHLSNKDVSQWIEKANRYTSVSNRVSEDDGGRDLIGFAHNRIAAWVGQSTIEDRGAYPAAVAVLRAVYDIIDRLKLWESEEEGGGDAAFEAICRKLNAEYAQIYGSGNLPAPHPARAGRVEVMDRPRQPEEERNFDGDSRVPASRARLLRGIIETTRAQADNALSQLAAAELRVEAAELRAGQIEVVRRQLEERLAVVERLYATRLDTACREARISLAKQRQIETQLDNVLSSEFWKITAPLRFLTSFFRGLAFRNGHRVHIALRALKPTNIDHRREVLRALRRRVSAVIGLAPPMSDAAIRDQHVRSSGAANSVAPKSIKHLAPHEAAVVSYPLWLRRFDTPTAIELEYLEQSGIKFPEIRIVARFSGETHHLIDRTVKALKTSIGIRWNAVFISDDADHNAFQMACAEAFQDDTRFHLQDPHPDFMSEFVVLLEAGAIPRNHGIRLLVEPMIRNADLALVYSDEDRLSSAGRPEFPWLKPEYDPLLAAQGMLFGRMFSIRTDRGCSRLAIEMILDPGCSILEIAKEITRGVSKDRIGHAAHVLFHDAQPPAPVLPLLRPALETLPVVSIIIPTRDRWDFLGPCLASLRITDWPAARLEIIVVDNGSTDIEVLENLAGAEARNEIRVIRDDRKFNFAALNNLAAKAARGDVFVLLNNDTEIIDPAWLRKLCAYAVLPDVGAVGAKLLYSDRTVQHGGVILGIQGVAGHAHLFLDENEGGYQQLANVTHEVAAVTGACLAVSRVAFEAVGGLREEFAVAFNDIVFCMDLHDTGRRNIYVADCVLIHHESKTRGFDTTPQKIEIARSEALLTWRFHSALMRDDPCYSPNLSLESPYELAFAPRRRALWRRPVAAPLKVMMLSSTYARGHGVAVVIDLQVRALRERGHEVILAGTKSSRDFTYDDMAVMEVSDSRSAATLGADLQVDVIVVHTPPFFGVARWTGSYPPVLAYDYGEPPADFFPDAAVRREILAEKNLSLRMCTKVFTISEAIADESLVPPDGVIPLGNSHLGTWAPVFAEQREAVRRNRGWDSHFVILNVCRFHAGERSYKGIDQYAEVLSVLKSVDPELAANCVFVLCGKGDAQDVAEVQLQGLTAIANVSDEELIELYAAADMYMNFSRWEGYNLGIGQALAMGLPVIASDIPAHRAFGITVKDNPVSAAFSLRDQLRNPTERIPRLWTWDEPLRLFTEMVERMAMTSPESSTADDAS